MPGYSTGGSIHFVINNQVGFTTCPQFARSSPYPSDVAKGVQAPILHVNGDDPEAVTFACKLAIEFRQTFKRDIVIDMWCYRRFGHNEGDEPSFTQPLMYKEISQHPPISEIYGAADRGGRHRPGWIDQRDDAFSRCSRSEFEAAISYLPNKADWFEGRWAGLGRAGRGGDRAPQRRHRRRRGEVRELGEILTTVPDGFADPQDPAADHRRQEARCSRAARVSTGRPPRRSPSAACVAEGHAVRLSGQDSGRGTFSQRHAVWVDQQTGAKYIPLTPGRGGRFEVRDSPLSEFGVLGFEYGYSLADPQTLVLWEAQFGDFANGAQTIIDQFIAAGEAKWLRASGLVMLLPHGFEGQGPEHSSARPGALPAALRRGQYAGRQLHHAGQLFPHARRQMHRDFRKPLIMMTPKSLLRHKLAVSNLADFTGDSHFRRILSDLNPPAEGEMKRLVLCSGKLAYELIEARDKAGDRGTEIVRIEQLYPFPCEPLVKRLKAMTNLEDGGLGAGGAEEQRLLDASSSRCSNGASARPA